MDGPTLENLHRIVVGLDERVAAHISHEDSMPGKLDGLHERVERLEAGQRVIAAGHVSLTAQMAEVTTALHHQHAAATDLRAEMQRNSDATQQTLHAAREIRDIVTTATTLGRLARWVGPTVVAAAVAWGVAAGWAHALGATVADLFRAGGPPR